jgi:hypothetical protein
MIRAKTNYDFIVSEQATGRSGGAVGLNQLNRVRDFL